MTDTWKSVIAGLPDGYAASYIGRIADFMQNEGQILRDKYHVQVLMMVFLLSAHLVRQTVATRDEALVHDVAFLLGSMLREGTMLGSALGEADAAGVEQELSDILTKAGITR